MARIPRIPLLRTHRATVSNSNGGIARTAVLASAVLVRQSQLRAVRTADWQREGWEFYDVVPELHQGVTWYGNCLSRVRLYVARIDPDADCAPVPIDDPELQAPLKDFFGGATGQAEMLRRVGMQLQIPGESFLVAADLPNGERLWQVASAAELETTANNTYLRTSTDNHGRIKLEPDKSMIMRLWYPHAERAWEADSPARSLRGTLRELQGIAVRLSAEIESRLAGAGLLIIPESATLPTPAQTDNTNPLHADPFVAELIRAMITPITDRDSAAAVVPMVIRVPDDAVDVVRHLTFSTPLDEKLVNLRADAVRRAAIGMDMPPEALLGLSDTNHWNAWQIDENGIKIHIEPTLQLITDAISTQYLRPVLARDELVADPAEYCVWFNTDDLSQPANRGPEARELYNMGLISGGAARRESGFSDVDAPSPAEAAAKLAVTLATANPELAVQLWAILASTGGIPNPAIEVSVPPELLDTGPPTPPPAVPTPTPPPGIPNQGVAPRAASVDPDAGWMAAVEMGVMRALEVAGKRLLSTNRTYRGRFADVPAHQLHQHIAAEAIEPLLVGAFTPLRHAIPDQPCIVRAVDRYVRHLIRNQVPHQRAALVQELARIGCVPGSGDRG